MSPRRHHRLLAGLSGLALALTTGVAPGHAAQTSGDATPAGATPTGAPPASATAEPRQAGSTTVTLITGDVVDYRPTGGGPPSLGIRPAPRPGNAPVTFATLPDADGGYLVMPSDAAGLVSAGTLDDELFDVETLVREQRTETIPLIVTYSGKRPLAQTADALPATEDARPLNAVNGAAVRVEAGGTAAFWAGLQQDRRTLGRSATGIAKIWLDRKVTMSLDQSVPLIGAPTGWERGLDGTGTKVAVLDTGIDPKHPDFAGRIIAAENFTNTESVIDRKGHGTHVASTIAGSGAASGGKYKGVAPGASLMIGKVLDDSGNGEWSWTITGMEWAAQQGADVVNMSLGGTLSDGTDPQSQALNTLSKQYGTLFVAAAGNGGDPLEIESPGAADEALAVGAVDKVTGTTLADFSSRGPRANDAAVKPNIVAPGVDIVAARAAGSGLTPAPDNDQYTAESGTSMATPHVAGAAAILAQQHPGWNATELRDALVSTSRRDDEHNWFEQGGGRVDVARAVTQQVFATSVVDFHLLDGKAVTRQVTYRNTGTADVTLDVATVTRGWSGRPAPEGAIRLGAGTVTVPAGGTAAVDLTVDPSVGDVGAYGGWVTAAAGDVRLVTPFSYYTGPAAHQLKISMNNSYGTKEFYHGYHAEPLVYMIPLRRGNSPEDPFNPAGYYTVHTDYSGDAEVTLPAGDYEVIGLPNDSRVSNRSGIVVENVHLDGDRTVTLDARKTVPVNPVAPEAAQGRGDLYYVRTFSDRENPIGIWRSVVDGGELYVTPGAPEAGELRLTHQWELEQPAVATATAGRLRLHPVYSIEEMRAFLTAPQSHPVVSVGRGRAEDFDGIDVTGRFVLAGIPVGGGESPYLDAVRAMDEAGRLAAERGAAGMLGYLDVEHGMARIPALDDPRFPGLGLTAAEGRDLRSALDRGPVTLRLEPYGQRPFVYHLRYDRKGRVPGKPEKVDRRELARIDADYHAALPDTAGRVYGESSTGEEPGGHITFGGPVRMPVSRTEYYGPVSDRVVWSRTVDDGDLLLHADDRFTRHDRTRSEQWFKAPVVPGAADLPDGQPVPIPCALCRDGSEFVPAAQWRDSDPGHYGTLINPVSSSTPVLSVDGAPVPPNGRSLQTFTVPADGKDYRLDTVDHRQRPLSPQVVTSSRFTSAPPSSGTPEGYACSFGPPCAFQPALQVTYDLPLDLLNRARAGHRFAFDLRAAPHSGLRRAPEVRDLRVEYSVDDGTTWRAASRVKRQGEGRFQAEVSHPPLDRTSGYVSLRVTATDTEGGSVTQTVTRAYALK
ncbi:S8 family serine peptidase [Nonomuraea sp. B12E4]|uniref:S8 family serine peptidase n=1 Tax=Nonomuraea sp. B12E4 TaxID=3153564 RepID=UPI00325F8F84